MESRSAATRFHDDPILYALGLGRAQAIAEAGLSDTPAHIVSAKIDAARLPFDTAIREYEQERRALAQACTNLATIRPSGEGSLGEDAVAWRDALLRGEASPW